MSFSLKIAQNKMVMQAAANKDLESATRTLECLAAAAASPLTDITSSFSAFIMHGPRLGGLNSGGKTYLVRSKMKASAR